MTAAAALPAAGWYPDPGGYGARYWTGEVWSWQWRPDLPPVLPEMPKGYRVVYRPPSHGFHMFMSFLTCGAWIPVWMAAAGGRYKVKRGHRR